MEEFECSFLVLLYFTEELETSKLDSLQYMAKMASVEGGYTRCLHATLLPF